MPDILQGLLASNCLVLEAPPGAGKTTTVPLAMLLTDPTYLEKNKTILVLEPRRVAAKAAARRMAALLGEQVGQTVGYRVRLDTKVSRSTRIEVVTDGILLRRLQQDPELKGVGAVLFDEFHERGLDSDLSLALCLDAQRMVAPELRLLVMSATLGGGLAERLVKLMSDGQQPAVPLVRSEGRSFPVKTKYLGSARDFSRGAEERHIAGAVLLALKETSGDVLCFLPGVGEIYRVWEVLERAGGPAADVAILPLHGNLSPSQQDAAIRADPSGRRRVVLSTNIAESSVTLAGVRAVVDTGQCRRLHYDPARGQDRLILEMVSASSADQRRGRAGRTAPGTCYRLWEESNRLEATAAPEIALADLTPMVLQLAMWGDPSGLQLPWVDSPDKQRVALAQQLLRDLGALTQDGKVTEEGRRMAALAVHPRLAHMVLRGASIGATELAALLAALLSERDILRGEDAGADVLLRLEALTSEDTDDVVQRILQTADQILRQLSWQPLELPTNSTGSNGNSMDDTASTDDDDDDGPSASSTRSAQGQDTTGTSAGMDRRRRVAGKRERRPGTISGGAWQAQMMQEGLVGVLLAAAYPDRIAKRQDRSNKRSTYMMRDGNLARLGSDDDELSEHAWLAVAELGSTDAQRSAGRNDTIRLAAPLTLEAINSYLSDLVEERVHVFWAPASKNVMGRRQRWLGALMLAELPIKLEDEQALPVVLKAVKDMGIRSFLPPAGLQWCERVVWLKENSPADSDLPDMSEEGLQANMEQWLAPHLYGVRSRADLVKLNWDTILRSRLTWNQQQRVEEQAPAKLLLPTGTSVAINYSRDNATVSVRIQEVFGMLETPRLAGGRVPLVMELLAPGHQPLQITSDLSHFWANSYAAVKRSMMGPDGYPKHYWPDDPAQAEPTRLTKKGLERAAAQAAAQAESKEDKGTSKAPAVNYKSKKSGKRR